MKTMKRVGAAVFAITALAAGTAGSAQAGPALESPSAVVTSTTGPSFARVVGSVIRDRRNPRNATVTAIYRCTGEGTLWVSVKQTADRTADPALSAEGSSAIAAAWSDSHRNAVTCDGRTHVGRFSVDQVEPYFTENGPTGQKSDVYGPLERGQGYVQFCLFDDLHTDEPISDMTFHRVV